MKKALMHPGFWISVAVVAFVAIWATNNVAALGKLTAPRKA